MQLHCREIHLWCAGSKLHSRRLVSEEAGHRQNRTKWGLVFTGICKIKVTSATSQHTNRYVLCKSSLRLIVHKMHEMRNLYTVMAA